MKERKSEYCCHRHLSDTADNPGQADKSLSPCLRIIILIVSECYFKNSKGGCIVTTRRMSIKSMFKTKQAVLESKLSILIDRPVIKGEHCESAYIDFFRSFLPNKYALNKGFVFDDL